MDKDIKVWLYDAAQAIDEIEGYFANSPMIFADFQADIKTKRAVERNLEIIGEAINRITKKDNSFAIDNTRKIIDTRNRIIHGYDSVSDDLIWVSLSIIYQN